MGEKAMVETLTTDQQQIVDQLYTLREVLRSNERLLRKALAPGAAAVASTGAKGLAGDVASLSEQIAAYGRDIERAG